MRISSRTWYALRTIVELCENKGQVVRIVDIAERQRIPRKFLEQIVLLLKGSGIIESRRGARGGYFFPDGSEKRTLDEVVVLTNETMVRPPAVLDSDLDSAFGEIIASIVELSAKKLKSITIGDYYRRVKEARGSVGNYTI